MDKDKILHKHNKKRNAGLLYEFLVRFISNAVIEHDDLSAKKAIKIFNRFFGKNTEIHREFRLINSLVRTNVASDNVASNILYETKIFSKTIDQDKLEHEKSLLIKEINYNLQDEKFFARKIPEYKIYATIQNLFCEWRNQRILNVQKVAEYEEAVINWLLSKKETPKTLEEENLGNTNDLVVKIMMEKLNSRYGNELNLEQKEIIKEYVFSQDDKNNEKFVEFLQNIKENTSKVINEYLNSEENIKNKTLEEKLISAKEKIENETFNVVDDKLIERFLKYSQLKEEIVKQET